MLSINVSEQIEKKIKRKANSVARKNGYGKATVIIIGNEDKVVDRVDYGYRKYTTGEYVPNAYRAKFGWKNTYYQSAETTVMIDVSSISYNGKGRKVLK